MTTRKGGRHQILFWLWLHMNDDWAVLATCLKTDLGGSVSCFAHSYSSLWYEKPKQRKITTLLYISAFPFVTPTSNGPRSWFCLSLIFSDSPAMPGYHSERLLSTLVLESSNSSVAGKDWRMVCGQEGCFCYRLLWCWIHMLTTWGICSPNRGIQSTFMNRPFNLL